MITGVYRTSVAYDADGDDGACHFSFYCGDVSISLPNAATHQVLPPGYGAFQNHKEDTLECPLLHFCRTGCSYEVLSGADRRTRTDDPCLYVVLATGFEPAMGLLRRITGALWENRTQPPEDYKSTARPSC